MTVDTAPPIPAQVRPEPLAEWEKRLLDKARELRNKKSRVTMLVEFSGPAMLISVAAPAGRFET